MIQNFLKLNNICGNTYDKNNCSQTKIFLESNYKQFFKL